MGAGALGPEDAYMTSTPASSRLFIVSEPVETAPRSAPASAEHPVRRFRLARLHINHPPPSGEPVSTRLARTYD